METFSAVNLILLWIVVLLNFALTLGLGRRINNRLPQIDILRPGEMAPQFTAQTLQGNTITLSTYAQRPTAFIFVSPECQPCREAISRVEALKPFAKALQIELILVSDSDVAEAESLVRELNVTLPILTAPRQNNPFFKDYKVISTPYYCLVDTQGKVRASNVGIFNLENEMEALSSNPRP